MKLSRIVNLSYVPYFLVVLTLLTPYCVNHARAMQSLYNMEVKESKGGKKQDERTVFKY